MKKTRFLAIVCLLVLTISLVVPAANAEVYKWIKTNTGKGLRVRSTPSTADDSNIVDVLPYGTQVRVDGYEKNGTWALISVGGARGCYVATRYLVDYNPGSKPSPTAKPTATPTPKPTSKPETYAVDFSTFKHVKPYQAYVSTSSPVGRVNLRWAPGTAFASMDVCYQGAELTVLAEGKGWCQVQLNSNGYVGFMSSKYIAKK